MELTMYDKLLLLPLFQGLCKSDLTHILEKVKLEFTAYQPGEYLIRQGDTCNRLLFLLEGEMVAESVDEANSFVLSEQLQSPYIIEPYSLYGMHTTYTASYIAESAVSTLSIDKGYVLTELSRYPIFQLNFLNLLSNRVQNIRRKLWHTHIGDVREKVVNFLLLRCERPTGRKVLRVRMEDLAGLINETRLNVSKVLNDYQSRSLVELSRKEILIHDLDSLVNDRPPAEG